MSRYKQLSEIVQTARAQARTRFNDCVQTASALMQEFRNLLEIPAAVTDAIKYRPVTEPAGPRQDMQYTLPGSLSIDEDGRYHVGVLFKLHLPGGEAPEHTELELVFEWLSDGRYEVRYARELPTITVDRKRPETLIEFAETLCDALAKYYQGERLDDGLVIAPPEPQD